MDSQLRWASWAMMASMVAAVACGSDGGSETPATSGTDGGDPDAGLASDSGEPAPDGALPRSDSGGPVTQGLVVHTAVMGGPMAKAFVGTSATSAKSVDANGDVRFDDSEVSLPASVTVAVYDPTYDVTLLTTVAGIDRREIWLTQTAPDGCPCSSQGGIAGGIVNVNGTANAVARATDGFSRRANIIGTTYSLELNNRPVGSSSTYDIVAWDGTDNRPNKVGAKGGVSPTANGFTSADVTLDHLFDQPVQISVTNDGPAGGAERAELQFDVDGASLFFNRDDASPAFPVTLHAPVLDGALAIVNRAAAVFAGNGSAQGGLNWTSVDPAATWAYTRTPIPKGQSSATVPMLTPAKIVAPTLGTQAAPGSAAAAGLNIAWDSGDPSASVVTLEIRSDTKGKSTGVTIWTAYLPAATKQFTAFALPAGVAPQANLRADTYSVSLAQLRNPTVKSVGDMFGSPGGPDVVDHRDEAKTAHRGILTLH